MGKAANQDHEAIPAAIPTLDEMAGDWLDVVNLLDLPAINNFHGCLEVNRDNVLGVWNLWLPPYYHPKDTGDLSINGHKPQTVQTRWFPHQALRRGQVEGVEIETAVRMPFEAEGVLFRIQLKNSTRKNKPIDMAIELLGSDRSAFDFADISNQLEKGQASWKFTLEPGQSKTIDYVLAISDKKDSAVAAAGKWAKDFDTVFKQAKDLWQGRYYDAFTPGNKHFSGNLPVLVTDDEKIETIKEYR